MQRIASKLFNSTLKHMVHNTNEARPYFKLLAIYLWSYLFFYCFNQLIIKSYYYEDVFIRLFISSLGFIFFFHSYWEKKFKTFLPIIFYFTVFLSFGFFFSYMLFKNPHSNIWQINELTGLLLLAVFVDWRSFTIISISSTLLAFILVANEPFTNYSHLIGVFGTYSSPIICLFIFTVKRKNLQKERQAHHAHIEKLNNSLEIKIQYRTAELQKALTIKTEFLNNISHEIRTPLHGFLSLSEGLADNWNTLKENTKHKCVLEVSANAKRLSSLVNNILDFSKLTSNKITMNIEQISVTNMLKDILKEYHSSHLINKNINIIFSSSQDFIADIDSIRMKQVFSNILINAITFTPDEGEIKINITSKDDNMNISISDSGIGIPKNELKDIFSSFTQSSRTKTGAGGRGLGLSIAKNIIEAHKGKILAESNKSGSTFYITFPKEQ